MPPNKAMELRGITRVPWRKSSPFIGQIDHVSHRIVRGWAWYPKRPRLRVGLDVFYRRIFLGHVAAGMHRPDLEAHGIGDGYHGFTFHVPDTVPSEDIVPSEVCVASSGPRRWTLPFAGEIAPPGLSVHELTTSYREILRPYLKLLRSVSPAAAGLEISSGCRTKVALLCADVPNLNVSAFVEHIAYKYARDNLLVTDQIAFWRWYLGSYAMERGPLLAPLSKNDLLRLRRSCFDHRTFAEGLFVPPDAENAACAWAMEADRLFVADSLLSDETLKALRATDATRAAFPLSVFMRCAQAKTASLRALPSFTLRQRKRLYALFMILGLRQPSILSYLPGDWMRKLLAEGQEFQASLTALFGADAAIDSVRYVAEVEALGYDLGSQTFAGHFYQGNRVRGGPAILTTPAKVDVQLFGPFTRKMGLGESCRRVASALQETSLSVNFVDYDIGAGGGLGADQRLSKPRSARLNILHLNGEEIPEALAYLPDVFSQSLTVAMPYWELNRLSRVHRLGVAAVDEIWSASRFLANVFAEGGKTVRWIGMCCSLAPAPSAAQRAALRSRLGLAPAKFTFLTTSDALSWVQRKNPLAVVEAFRAAFATDDVALVVKTHNLCGSLSDTQRRLWDRIRSLSEIDLRILLIDQSFDAAEQRTLLAASDCLVSLHRAEGLGLDIVDALALGTPVVATDYSGTRDFCTPETAWLVDCDLRPVGAFDYSFVEPGQVWAEPRLESAIEALRGVTVDRDERERRITNGKKMISTVGTTQLFAERIEDAARAILGT